VPVANLSIRLSPEPATRPPPFNTASQPAEHLPTYAIDSDFTRGVGPRSQGPCRVTYTYVAQSRMPAIEVPIGTEMDYNYRMTVTDVGRTSPLSAIREGTVHVFPGTSRSR
jgi:hypothetical protein